MASHSTGRARIEPTIVAFAAIIGSVLGVPAAVAQEPALNVDVGKCAGLESSEERFACYEAAVDAAKKQPRPEATAQAPAANGAAPPAQPTAGGVQEAAVAPAAQNGAATQEAKAGRAERERVEFSATVTGLRETLPNEFAITLDNGQVWRQVHPEALYRLRSGQKVRLYSTGWGSSFRLEAEGTNGFIQVRRVK
jgi:hypothetical protein